MKHDYEVKPISGELLADIFAIIVSEFPNMTFDEAQAIIDNGDAFSKEIERACLRNCAWNHYIS
ncbi:hypothetical protein HYV69_02925 [Candidatus Uhrbacteria bacterium]|nr:hypothetical protein [Candidatus Uhrbacteria bacterium]